MLRAFLAVLAGLVGSGLVAMGLDAASRSIFHSQYGDSGEIRSIGLLILMLNYTMVCYVLGGWITAVLARKSASIAVIALSGLLIALTVFDMVLLPNPMPTWWRVAVAGLAGPLTLVGGWIRSRQSPFASRSTV